MTLFSPDDYPSPADSDKPTRKRPTRKLNEVVVSDGYWHILSGVEGVIDYCHRLDPMPSSSLVSAGSTVTRCSIIGRRLATPARGTEIHPCPECIQITGWR